MKIFNRNSTTYKAPYKPGFFTLLKNKRKEEEERRRRKKKLRKRRNRKISPALSLRNYCVCKYVNFTSLPTVPAVACGQLLLLFIFPVNYGPVCLLPW